MRLIALTLLVALSPDLIIGISLLGADLRPLIWQRQGSDRYEGN
jgi:hypothetical protein